MPSVKKSVLVQHSALQMFDLVDQVERYCDFLPWCAAAEVLEREPGRTVAKLTLAVPGVRQSFTTENRNIPGQSIEMRLVEGPFKKFEASWRFTPLGAAACKAEFSLGYEFASPIAATALQPVLKRLADGTVEAFSRRAR